MTADKPLPLVPKLRFPEFREHEPWDVERMGTLGAFLPSLSGKTAKDFDSGKARFIPYMNVFSNTFIDTSDLRSVDIAEGESQNAVVKGDVFFTVSSETPEDAGMSSVLLEEIADCYLNSFCTLFRFDQGRAPNPVFLGYMLRSASARTHLSRGAQGATRYNISKGVFRDVPLLLTSPPEQQKIADCLGSLDDLIAAEGRKLEALRRHKQGLMQKLFPQEGETVPRLRFPEYQKCPSWRRQKFGDVATFLNGRAFTKDELLESGKYRVLRVGNFFTSDHWYFSDLELDDDKYCEDGDLLYAWSASFGPRVWRGDRVIYHYHIWKVIARNSVDGSFLYACLSRETKRMRSESANGLGMMHLTKAGIEAWECVIPEDREEQISVARCLQALDDLIAAQAEKINFLQTHKQGLLQQLFPSLGGNEQ